MCLLILYTAAMRLRLVPLCLCLMTLAIASCTHEGASKKQLANAPGAVSEVVEPQQEPPPAESAASPSVDAAWRGQLKEWRVDVYELEEGVSIGLGEEHLDNAGRIRGEVLDALQKLQPIVGLSFFRADVTDATLEQVSKFAACKSLSLDSKAAWTGLYTDRGVEHLARLQQLQELHLFSASEVTDAAIPVLAGLTRLEHLYVSDAQFTDTALTKLESLEHLLILELVNCDTLHGSGLAFLNRPKFARLSLHGCDITDEGLSQLTHLPGLKRLSLGYNDQLRGTALAFLKHSPRLDLLDLGGCSQLEDVALEPCRALRSLEHVSASGTRMTDEGLAHLRGLPALSSLRLSGTQVTKGAVERFRKDHPQVDVSFE